MEVSQGKSTINAGYSIAMSDLMVDIHGYSPFQAKKRFGTFFQICGPTMALTMTMTMTMMMMVMMMMRRRMMIIMVLLLLIMTINILL
jgi:hypothetical protein